MPLFSRYIELTAEIVRTHSPPTRLQALGDLLEAFLAQTGWSFDDEAQPGTYNGRLLYEDPDTGFIAVAMAWGPGSQTSVHDHGTWGVFGVTEGTVQFTNFSAPDPQHKVHPVARFEANRGDITWVRPPDMEIHQLHNPTARLARSLHLYGRNIGF